MLQSNLNKIPELPELLRPFLIDKEAEKLKAYLDPTGLPTIGIGITSYSFVPSIAKKFGRNHVVLGDTITKDESRALYNMAVSDKAKAVVSLLKVPQTKHQLAALTSLVFNWGQGNFQRSRLLRAINEQKPISEITQIFKNTATTSKGVSLRGLTIRRQKETELYTGSASSILRSIKNVAPVVVMFFVAVYTFKTILK